MPGIRVSCLGYMQRPFVSVASMYVMVVLQYKWRNSFSFVNWLLQMATAIQISTMRRGWRRIAPSQFSNLLFFSQRYNFLQINFGIYNS